MHSSSGMSILVRAQNMQFTVQPWHPRYMAPYIPLAVHLKYGPMICGWAHRVTPAVLWAKDEVCAGQQLCSGAGEWGTPVLHSQHGDQKCRTLGHWVWALVRSHSSGSLSGRCSLQNSESPQGPAPLTAGALWCLLPAQVWEWCPRSVWVLV